MTDWIKRLEDDAPWTFRHELLALVRAALKTQEQYHGLVCGEVQQKTNDRTYCACRNHVLGAALTALRAKVEGEGK